MIPQKLELTNFLSYRETAELDFTGIELACISGSNGAGKSSILDAITWALFGSSRSRSDDDLVNRLAAINGDTAEVRFTFILEGISYRVIRRKRPGKGTVLELQIAAGDGNWNTLSERKMRETQGQIEHLLRMNYDTFTNASFLLQGKADQFTTRTPNQRKQILAELLGVTEWERYRETAAEARKLAEGQSALVEARLAEIQSEMAEKTEREATLKAVEARRAEILARLQLQEKLLIQLRRTAAAVEQQRKLVTNLAGSVERVQRNLAAAQQTLAKREAEKEEKAQIVAKSAEIMAEYASWQMAEAAVAAWQVKSNAYNDAQRKMEPFRIRVAEKRSQLEQEQKQLEAEAERVQEAVNAGPALEETIKKDAARQAAIARDLAEMAALEKALIEAQAALQQLEGERKLEQQELARLESEEGRLQKIAVEKTAVLANQVQAIGILAALEQQIVALAEQQEQYIETKAALDTLRGRQPLLRKEMETLKERIDRLEAAELDSACPTCGQPLSAEHRQAVLTDLRRQGKKAGDDFRANTATITAYEAEVERLQGAFRQKERVEREQKTNQQRLAQAEARLNEIEQSEVAWAQDGERKLTALRLKLADRSAIEAQEALVADFKTGLEPKEGLLREQEVLRERAATNRAAAEEMARRIRDWESGGKEALATVRVTLNEQAFASEERAAIAELEEQIAAIGYDSEAQQAALAQRTSLAHAPDKYQELKQAEAILGSLENNIAELAERIAEQEQEIGEQSAGLETAERQLQELIEGSGDLHSTEDIVNGLREEEIEAVRAVGVAQQKLDVLGDLLLQQGELEQERVALSVRIQRIKLLEKSCGREGVQALLIEHALPEIEERANELLERLTGGDMRIFFDTQRQLKTRDALAETLDIRIEDKDGVRPYDNYSGGEQFRVNFAIRLALSQLLARRAGARLQTLVVDEGFGSQDPQGRQRLVEAINAVRGEFACILVITHIAELRDAFSTRIEVDKGLNGSTIRVV